MDGCTKRLGFDVLTAPLAAVDRRGLSQAWYSALRLARDARSTTPFGAAGANKPAPATVHQLPTSHTGCPTRNSATGFQPQARRDGRVSVEVATERRVPRNALARKIERTFSQPRRPRRHATFVLNDPRGRVHVTIRTDGSSVRLFAICAPSAGAQVARALDDVRYTLARRAVHVDACFRESAR